MGEKIDNLFGYLVILILTQVVFLLPSGILVFMGVNSIIEITSYAFIFLGCVGIVMDLFSTMILIIFIKHIERGKENGNNKIKAD